MIIETGEIIRNGFYSDKEKIRKSLENLIYVFDTKPELGVKFRKCITDELEVNSVFIDSLMSDLRNLESINFNQVQGLCCEIKYLPYKPFDFWFKERAKEETLITKPECEQ